MTYWKSFAIRYFTLTLGHVGGGPVDTVIHAISSLQYRRMVVLDRADKRHNCAKIFYMSLTSWRFCGRT